jgi:outer membrane protein TolC
MRLAVKAAGLARDAAEETRRVASDRYREKAILLSDLLRADAAVADARRRADEALLSYWSARTDLDRTLGTEP